jgi:hypothetical protein
VRYIRSFGRFWWDFIVGDDWRVALGVAAVLVLTGVLVDAGIDAWWLMAPAIAVVLYGSLRRAVRPQ